ncbi:MAG: hypothetical protein NC928_01760, partial [Candidatus Omnitrophica bacterium]|nr:hypothetical protein [Candidatus Omnitrophota bacterium]
MKKKDLIDCLACAGIKIFGPLIRGIPKSCAYFLGRRLGDLLYCFDLRHRAIAYANIKSVFINKLSPAKLS